MVGWGGVGWGAASYSRRLSGVVPLGVPKSSYIGAVLDRSETREHEREHLATGVYVWKLRGWARHRFLPGPRAHVSCVCAPPSPFCLSALTVVCVTTGACVCVASTPRPLAVVLVSWLASPRRASNALVANVAYTFFACAVNHYERALCQ